MSRRLRVEEQDRLQSNKKEFLDQDKLKLRKERIHGPILWRTIPPNFKIVDLQEKFYDEALLMIHYHALPHDVVTRNAEIIDDEESLKSLLDKAKYFLKDCTSLAAVEVTFPPQDPEDPNPPKPVETLIGFVILKAVHQSDYGRVFLSVLMTDGDAQKKCINLYSALHRGAAEYFDNNLSCDCYLASTYLCIKPGYDKKNFQYQLMKSAMYEAKSLNIPVISGIFGSFSQQLAAKKVGLKILYEIAYVDWRDKNGDIIFTDPGPGNYTCAFMAGHVSDVSIIQERPPPVEHVRQVQVPVPVVPQPKRTRIQRREIIAKEMQQMAKLNKFQS